MKYYKDENNQVYGYAKDGSQDEYITDNLVEITKEEVEKLTVLLNRIDTSIIDVEFPPVP